MHSGATPFPWPIRNLSAWGMANQSSICMQIRQFCKVDKLFAFKIRPGTKNMTFKIYWEGDQ